MRFPIRVRLTSWYLAVLCFCLAILGSVIFLAARASVSKIIDSDLRARLSATRSFMEQQIPSAPPSELQDEFQEYSASQPGGALLQIKDESGAWIFRSLSMQKYAIVLPPSGPDGNSQFASVARGNQSLRIIAGKIAVNGKTYAVQIGADTTNFMLVLQRLKWLLLISTPLAIGLALAGGYWLSSRALAPVRRVTQTARSIGGDELSRRVEVPQTGDELQFLAQTLNAMLARIESSFKRMTQFTADASHELRTPVTIIRTTAEIALRQKRDEEMYRKALKEVLEEAERTSSLIDDLLTLARADSAAQQLALAPTNVAEVMEMAFSKTKFLATEKAVAVSLQIVRRDLWIEGNQEALLRLFLVLFDNAVKYTPAGGRVSAVLDVVKGRAVFRIQDSGIGIPPEDLPHVFERFYRADKARNSQGGVGLGLAIAKWIADAHAAEIHVESTPGQGSVFTVEFLRSRVEMAEQPVEAGAFRSPKRIPSRSGL
ncbi:MAG TPA: ATP-binding protein [Candidatus Angelobacter sp.]|jgi:heavy metal sensor kinase|nr:ATP-binding protein [Candidatus Angelobacter sp.]